MRKLVTALVGFGLAALMGSHQAAAQIAVVPVVNCVEVTDGIPRAYFGYINSSANVVSIAVGQSNYFQPLPAYQGQATLFSPGTQNRVVLVAFQPDSSVAWYLNGVEARASLQDTSIPPCALPTPVLSTVVVGSGGGTVSADGLNCTRADGQVAAYCSVARTIDTAVTLTATPAEGSSFAGWGGACAGVDPTCTLTMNVAKTVTANFAGAALVNDIVIDPAMPTTLYSGLDGAGVYKKVGTGDWTASNGGLANLNVRALALADSATLYAATYSGGIYKSADGGANWAACAGQPANANLLSLVHDAANDKLYAGSVAGVFVSADGCASWTALNNGLPN